MSYPPPPSGFDPPPPGATYGYGVPGFQGPRANQLALWSMISGIVALPLMCTCGIGFFPAIAALTMGIIARGQIGQSQGTQSGEGQALAGVILGAVGIALSLVYLLLMFGLQASMMFWD